MGLKRVFAQGSGDLVSTDAASECRRCSAGKRRDPDSRRSGRQTFPDRLISVIEEVFEDTSGTGAAGLDIEKTDDLSRIDRQGPGLLRDQDPAAQKGRIVDFVSDGLAAEFNIGRGIRLLAPKSIENRETGILEPDDISPLIEFQRRGYRFADNDIGAAQGKPHEHVSVPDGILPALGRISGGSTAAGGRSPLSGRTSSLIFDDLNGKRLGRKALPFYFGCRSRKMERTRRLRQKDICIRRPGGFRDLSIDDLCTAGRAFLGTPDQLEIF